jgi:hypothetical protein
LHDERQRHDRRNAAARVERRIGVLEHGLHAPRQRAPRHLANVLARDPDRPRGRRQQAEQHPRQRRLARARLADDREDLALLDRQIDARDRMQLAALAEQAAAEIKRASEALGLDHGAHAARSWAASATQM